MPLFSRRSPKPGRPAPPQAAARDEAAAPGATASAPKLGPDAQFVAPPPLFRDEADFSDGGSGWSGAAPEGDERPDDPDAPPRPGAVRQSAAEPARPADLDSLLASGSPWDSTDPTDPAAPSGPSDPVSRAERAPDDDRFRRPTGRRRSDAPSAVARRERRAAATAAKATRTAKATKASKRSRGAASIQPPPRPLGVDGGGAASIPVASGAAAVDPVTGVATGSDNDPSGDPATDPLRSRILPAALLIVSVVIGLLSVLLVFLFEPGAVGWAIVGAIVLIAIVQLCLLVGGIAVVRRRTAKRLGVAAVLVTLLVNPLVATGVRGVVTAATGGSEAGSGADHDWDPIWDAYPGSKYADAKDVLGGPDYETFVSESDALLLDLRDTLTAEFGFEWVERQPAVTEPDHNGFGGDSMLFRYTAPVWQTTTTVTSLDDKNRVVELIRQVGLRHGIVNLDFQNAPAAWREPGELTETYGGETLDTQARWTLHTYDAIGSQDSFSADVIDLSLDSTGSVTKDRQFDVDYYDMAPDGIEFHIDSSSLLKAADRKAFIDALAPYAGLDKPK